MKRTRPTSEQQKRKRQKPVAIVPPGHVSPIPYPSLRYSAYVAAEGEDIAALEELVDPIAREFGIEGFCWYDYVLAPALAALSFRVVAWLQKKLGLRAFEARYRGRLLRCAVESDNLVAFEWLFRHGVDTTLTLDCVNRMAVQDQTGFLDWILDCKEPAAVAIRSQFEEHCPKRFACLAIERDSVGVIRKMREHNKLRWNPLMCHEAIRCSAKKVYRFMHASPMPVCDTPGCVMLREFYEEEY